MTDKLLQLYSILAEKMREIGIIPVIKLQEVDKSAALSDALTLGGVPCAEITFRADGAENVIKSMLKRHPKMLVGAGTVLSVEQCKRAIDAGASFCVAPGLNEKVVSYCIDNGVPFMPGIATPSELERAMEMGIPQVKFFPAEQAGGIAYIKAMCAAYSGVLFMPTGGISEANMLDYLSFKRVFCCGGSFLTPADYIKAGNFEGITNICQRVRSVIKNLD